MELLVEDVDLTSVEQSVYLEEATNQKKYYIRGPFIETEIKNKNGRSYPRPVIENELKNYDTLIESHRAVGELNHPNTLEINPENIAIKINKLAFESNLVIGEAAVCSSPKGMIVRNLIDDGIKLGVSTRGAGTLKQNIVQDDYKLIGVDVVWDPSAPSAFVEGILEAKTEWVLEQGILVEKEINSINKKLANIGKKKSEQALLDIFEGVMSSFKVSRK